MADSKGLAERATVLLPALRKRKWPCPDDLTEDKPCTVCGATVENLKACPGPQPHPLADEAADMIETLLREADGWKPHPNDVADLKDRAEQLAHHSRNLSVTVARLLASAPASATRFVGDAPPPAREGEDNAV